MTNDRQLLKFDAMRLLALRDGDTEAAARYEQRIEELLESDRLKVMDKMGALKFRMTPDCILRDIHSN